MPRRLTCADCGEPMKATAQSLPQGQARCHPCRRQSRLRRCDYCNDEYEQKQGAAYCSRLCANLASGERRAGVSLPLNERRSRLLGDGEERQRANWRRKNHHRRVVRHRVGDVSPGFERQLRVATKCCPLCGCRLTVKPYQRNSRELDHIIPIAAGGTHTIGNVRIICRECNQRRPKDGSDYAGPVTLWSQA